MSFPEAERGILTTGEYVETESRAHYSRGKRDIGLRVFGILNSFKLSRGQYPHSCRFQCLFGIRHRIKGLDVAVYCQRSLVVRLILAFAECAINNERRPLKKVVSL